MSDDILKNFERISSCHSTIKPFAWNFAIGGSTGEPASHGAGRPPVCRGGETPDNNTWARGSTG